MRLRLIYKITFLSFITCFLHSHPLVQKITNPTQVGYLIIAHSDDTDCSLQGKNVVIDANTTFDHPFLIVRGQPSLLIRPIYFQSKIGKQHKLVNEKYEFDYQKIEKAFDAWKNSDMKLKVKRKFKNAQDWFENWIGGDIEVKPHVIEIFGYLINLSQIQAENLISRSNSWLSFAKGVFSRLIFELDLVQHARRGINIQLNIFHGEGGLCNEGVVERL